jgi:MFS transporter, DHA1 family, inner membrane transport protein
MSAAPVGAEHRPTLRLAPDGLPAAFVLSFLATAGFFYVNIMGALVSGLVDGLHLSPAAAGRIGAYNVYGAAVGAFCAVLIVRRIAWRQASVLLLCSLIGLDVSSMWAHSSSLLSVLRFLHGTAGGLLVGLSYAVIARTRLPDRCFGVLMVVQSSLGGLGLMLLPQLVPSYGASVLFLSLAAFSGVALVLLPLLPDYGPSDVTLAKDSTTVTPETSRTWSVGLIISLFAVFFFQAGNMALSAYIIELGRAYGLTLPFVSVTIGVSGWVATLGSLLVVALAGHGRRMLPIAIGSVVAVLGNAAFHGSARPTVYLAANIVTAITWFFVIPYLLGLCATFDRTGRSAALAGLFSKLGLATGPYAASLFLSGVTSYGAVIDLAVGALVLATICGIAAARKVDSKNLPGLEPRPA